MAMRKLLADELNTPEVKEIVGNCVGLRCKIESGFDANPRTVAAIRLCRRLVEMNVALEALKD